MTLSIVCRSLENVMQSDTRQTQKATHCGVIYMASPEQEGPQRQKLDELLPGAGWGGGTGRIVVTANRDEPSFWSGGHVLEVDSCDSCTTPWIYQEPQNCTL